MLSTAVALPGWKLELFILDTEHISPWGQSETPLWVFFTLYQSMRLGKGASHMGIMHNFRLIATDSRFAA
jgi:hypothetical protein